MPTEDEIQQRIAQEQAKIEVPSYQDIALDGAWKRRSGAMWGVSMLGMAAGAVVGALALVAPAVFAALPVTAAMVGTSVAVFSALGLTAGWGIGVMVGFPSGAVASSMKEFERRSIARDIAQKVRENPEAEIVLGQPPSEPQKESNLISRYFNWKNSLVFACLGALGGVVFATALSAVGVTSMAAAAGAPAAVQAFAMPAMNFLLGSTGASASAITAYTVGVGATFGAMFGVNFPRLATKMANVGGGLLSGKTIGAVWPEDASLPLQPVISPVVSQAVEPEETPARPAFAAREQKPQTHEQLLAQSRKEAGTCGCQLGA